MKAIPSLKNLLQKIPKVCHLEIWSNVEYYWKTKPVKKIKKDKVLAAAAA